jgi:hypothetical protein
LWVITLALGFAVLMRSRPLFRQSLRFGGQDFLAMLPRIALGMIGSGFIAEMLPSQLIPSSLGPETGTLGLMLRPCSAR